MTEFIDLSPTKQIAGVVVPFDGQAFPPSDLRLQETMGLVEALGCECAFARGQPVRSAIPATLFGEGQVKSILDEIEAHGCNLFVVDGDLTPVQQRNLERRLGVKVIDRTALILEIFGLRARSKEGKLQVEAARLAYERSRLVRTWTHLERQRGGVGFLSGPGESQLEADRRMLDRAIKSLKKELANVRRTRAVQRARRSRRGMAVIALVGYTNAGKSTLFNRLTGASVLAKDMPFATLDPTVREIDVPTIGPVALIDTVGFITDLPTHLIDSFEATLEEAMDAELILHVRDISAPETLDQKSEVEAVLQRLETSLDEQAPPILEVWNKTDLLPYDEQHAISDRAASDDELPRVPISAKTGEGIDKLLELLVEVLRADRMEYKVHVPFALGAALAWLHEHAEISDEVLQEEDGHLVLVALSLEEAGRFQASFPGVTLIPRSSASLAESAPDSPTFTSVQSAS